MKVKRQHVEPDPSGDCGSCITYHFESGNEHMFGRRWQDEPDTGELLHWRDATGALRKFERIPYDHALFIQVVRHFLDSEGARNIAVLVFSEGKGRPIMTPVDLRRIPRT